MEPLSGKTATDLDWGRLLKEFAARCGTPMGLRAAGDLDLLADEAAVSERLAEVGEARALATAGDPLPLSEFVDVGSHLDRARRHAVLDPQDLLEVARSLGAARRLAAHLAEHRDQAPRLLRRCTTRATADARQLRELEELLLSCFEEDGTLADRASPELAVLRERVRNMRERLSRTVQELLDTYADVIQDSFFTIREDRYVLPIRTDAHRRVHGIVHGHSGSGQTIYVEPREITSLGNELVIARTEMAREEQRVLAELSEEVRLASELVEEAQSGAERADLRSAGARLAEDLAAAEPAITEDGSMQLRAARHPLLALDGAAVVANDVELSPGGVLVVSGPNGGGKTVALKTVGLVLLMLRAGLPVPADPDSRLPLAPRVWTDMGDDQSLEQSLSTFAAHMRNIARTLEQAGAGDVALFDELAGGTDPAEGAALAAEIATAVARRGVAVMCTTHYGSLKLMAMQEEGFSGASLGFDRESLSPTFRLSAGAPGVSGALAAARRYGLPEDLVDAARERMGQEGQRIDQLLEQLDAERERVRIQADSLVEERAELEGQRRALDAEREEARRRSRERAAEEAEGLLAGLRRARKQVRAVEERLRQRRRISQKEARGAGKELDEVAGKLAPGGALASALDRDPPPARPAGESDLVKGTRVFVPSMQGTGEVVEPPKRHKVRIALGRMVVTVDVSEVSLLEQEKPASRPVSRPAPDFDAAGDAEGPAMTSENTLDLRGERVDDAVREADKFIDRGLRKGWRNAFFIHGHGTGALRQALRRHFDESPYIERFRPADRSQGGDGVTVIWLA